ncbi:hypothetical protein GA8_03770 [Geobacillus sp. A8]|nr:hypothetical protein GA8_03770 [Geobacillus sp. A8]
MRPCLRSFLLFQESERSQRMGENFARILHRVFCLALYTSSTVTK